MPIARYCKECQQKRGWPTSDRTKVTTCTYCGTTGTVCFINDTVFLSAGGKSQEPSAEPGSIPVETPSLKRLGRPKNTAESFSDTVFSKPPDKVTVEDIVSLSRLREKLSAKVLAFLDKAVLSIVLSDASNSVTVDCSKTRLADVFLAVSTLRANGFSVDTSSLVAKQQLHISWSFTGVQADGQDKQAG